MPQECCPPAETTRRGSPPATAVGTSTSESRSPVPVCDRVFAPQHCAVPAAVTPQLCPPPAEMVLKVWPGAIIVGKSWSLVEEFPICADGLPPQHHADWSAATAQVCKAPVLITSQRVSPAIPCGVDRSMPTPSPSWPELPAPQQIAIPDVSRPQVCAPPAATWANCALEETGSGMAGLLAVPPRPSRPFVSRPQHQTAPV